MLYIINPNAQPGTKCPKRIVYWLGTNPPQYSIIHTNQLLGTKEQDHRQYLQQGMALLCKTLKTGKATSAESMRIQGSKVAIKLGSLPFEERFAALRDDLTVEEDFFFSLNDRKSFLNNDDDEDDDHGNRSGDHGVVDANYKEYLEDSNLCDSEQDNSADDGSAYTATLMSDDEYL